MSTPYSLDSPPPPISRRPSGIEFVPRRAMQSFENLVALANYEERLRGAKKIVWRDKGEKPVELEDIWDCLEHASRGGLSAYNCLVSLSVRSRSAQLPSNRFRGWRHWLLHSLWRELHSPARKNQVSAEVCLACRVPAEADTHLVAACMEIVPLCSHSASSLWG